MNLMQSLEQEAVKNLAQKRPVPEFSPGDTLRVTIIVEEDKAADKAEKAEKGNKDAKPHRRTQAFEGVCIARKNAGINSSFTLRKISYGEGVERIFPLYSPRIVSIEAVRKVHRVIEERIVTSALNDSEQTRKQANKGVQWQVRACRCRRKRSAKARV